MPLSFPTGQSLHFDVSTVPLPTMALVTPTLLDRALRDGELFEIVIQKMVDRWSGSIEAGEGPSMRGCRVVGACVLGVISYLLLPLRSDCHPA